MAFLFVCIRMEGFEGLEKETVRRTFSRPGERRREVAQRKAAGDAVERPVPVGQTGDVALHPRGAAAVGGVQVSRLPDSLAHPTLGA